MNRWKELTEKLDHAEHLVLDGWDYDDGNPGWIYNRNPYTERFVDVETCAFIRALSMGGGIEILKNRKHNGH